MNKAKAGYNMLMIISAADNKFQDEEKEVIQQFIKRMWIDEYDHLSLDKSLDSLAKDDMWPRFVECRDFFYSTATAQERNEFLQFAMDLVKADNIITAEENTYLKSLFNTWDPDNE